VERIALLQSRAEAKVRSRLPLWRQSSSDELAAEVRAARSDSRDCASPVRRFRVAARRVFVPMQTRRQRMSAGAAAGRPERERRTLSSAPSQAVGSPLSGSGRHFRIAGRTVLSRHESMCDDDTPGRRPASRSSPRPSGRHPVSRRERRPVAAMRSNRFGATTTLGLVRAGAPCGSTNRSGGAPASDAFGSRICVIVARRAKALPWT
jgi:hypothetical protein